MKIIKNNYTKEVIKDVPKTLRITCDRCDSELEVTEEDTHIGWLGAAYVICPCCGEEVMVEGLDGITLTKDNVEFPVHFLRTTKGLRNVVEVNPNRISKEIKEAIEYFRANKGEWSRYTISGDLFVSVYRYPGDEDYHIVISRDFYETHIPFEPQDYE